MNYYEHHIGDYDKNTAHLTACEDGIYSRMIRRYMDKEGPLPASVDEVKRLMRARAKDEKKAVDAVLAEFFSLEEDGWHHKTCDEVIEKYLIGEPEREVKKANEDNRMKRHRAERAELFKVLTDAGEHAAWNISITELREIVQRIQKGGPDTPETTDAETPPVTAPATPATATQTPDTNPHSPTVLIPQAPTGALFPSPSAKATEPSGQIAKVTKSGYEPPDCPHQEILALFREVLPACPQHTSWNGTRPTHLRARWRETAVEKRWATVDEGLLYFKKFFFYLSKSRFLMGKVPPKQGHKQFELELSWVVNATNWAKVHDGKYHTED